MVHLYGLFPRKTSNSNPAVVTVSQLGLFLNVSTRASLLIEPDTHMKTPEIACPSSM
jgi:hypothetical protein